MAKNDELCAVGKNFLKSEKIIYWPTPPESPDLNPIECVWHEMKHYLRKYAKPKTKAELEQGIYDFWKTMTPAKCSKYIGHSEKLFLFTKLNTT